ncbi:hypothetical protein C4D60_Mb11t13350 [Musa balbisiana]|uniref:Uncharacterized protein n=1 Tax=Musa balbisiana TaxID=52838 RepID=A0A4V4H5H3_MUSBA|nr:hypothetical protein C4D60_Mb11t13350 [Musa balbisiana]
MAPASRAGSGYLIFLLGFPPLLRKGGGLFIPDCGFGGPRLIMEKHNEKEHKKENRDTRKREGQKGRDKDQRKDKHKEKKNQRERHKDKKKEEDRDKGGRGTYNDRIEKPIQCHHKDRLEGSWKTEDIKHYKLTELYCQIKHEEKVETNGMVGNSTSFIQRSFHGSGAKAAKLMEKVASIRRSEHLRLAFRGMASPSRERHHENEQAGKNAKRTKVGMVEFELWLNVGNYT